MSTSSVRFAFRRFWQVRQAPRRCISGLLLWNGVWFSLDSAIWRDRWKKFLVLKICRCYLLRWFGLVGPLSSSQETSCWLLSTRFFVWPLAINWVELPTTGYGMATPYRNCVAIFSAAPTKAKRKLLRADKRRIYNSKLCFVKDMYVSIYIRIV